MANNANTYWKFANIFMSEIYSDATKVAECTVTYLNLRNGGAGACALADGPFGVYTH